MSNNSLANVELHVIGAGQMRTGTMSLQAALEHLYNGKCYHMQEVIKNKSHIPLWQKCVDKRTLSREMANTIFAGYVAAVDHPSAIFYRDLVNLYPNAKVILTVRNPDSWVRSVKETTMNIHKHNILIDIIFYLTGSNKFMKLAQSLIALSFQRTYRELEDDDSLLRECYIQFNDDVKKYVPAERLLIFEAKEGWAPLCKFLGKDIPDIPYPNVNSTEEFQEKIRKEVFKLLIKIAIPVAVVGAAASYLILRNHYGFFHL